MILFITVIVVTIGLVISLLSLNKKCESLEIELEISQAKLRVYEESFLPLEASRRTLLEALNNANK